MPPFLGSAGLAAISALSVDMGSKAFLLGWLPASGQLQTRCPLPARLAALTDVSVRS